MGLGLRNLAHCPVELNLMPESTLNWVQFNQKKPYFIFTAFSLVAVIFAFGLIFQKLAATNGDELEKLKTEIQQPKSRADLFKRAKAERDKSESEAKQIASWIDDRYYWADVLTGLHGILIQVEAQTSSALHTPTGVWIEKFITDESLREAAAPGTFPGPGVIPGPIDPGVDSSRRGRGRGGEAVNADGTRFLPPGMNPDGTRSLPTPVETPPVLVPGGTAKASSSNEVASINMVCRGVDVTSISSTPSANQDIAYAVEAALKENPLFDKDGTHLLGDNNKDANGTFTFGLVVKLKRPLKLQ